MGEIKKVLAIGEIEPRTLTSNSIWSDLCENIHLHYRNIRFDFSETEWAAFRAAINGIGLGVEKTAEEKNYREGDPNYLVQVMFNHRLKSDSKYYPNRSVIELQRDNTVHFHYRDLRIHMTISEFKEIAKAFTEAGAIYTLLEHGLAKEFPYKNLDKAERHWVDINLIQPYDAGHRPLAIDDDHRRGIDYVKELIQNRVKIRPIMVNTEGQRLDGFKRYMAHLELGKKEIECIVDPFGKMGGQHNQSFEDDGCFEDDKFIRKLRDKKVASI